MRQNYQISEQFPSREEEEALGIPVFLRSAYINLFSEFKIVCPIIIKDLHNKILAFWVFSEESEYWFSPISAPFSCPQIFNEIGFNELLDLSHSFLKLKSNKPIRFVFNPLFTGNKEFTFSKIEKIELNHFMKINEDSFMDKLPQKRRKQKLRVLKRGAYVVSKVSSENWLNVYQQNLKWRIAKGHVQYIPLDLMSQFKTRFPNTYLGFQLTYAADLIGCAFLVKVSDEYLYLYSLITNPEFDVEEPSLLLYESIYHYALEEKVKILDLGTSMNKNGRIHKNISQYKQEIGASAIKKYTFEC
jgi:hypothetical protein